MIDLLKLARKEGKIQLQVYMLVMGINEIIDGNLLEWFVSSNHYNNRNYKKEINKRMINTLQNGEIIHFNSFGEDIKNIVFLQEYQGNTLVCFIDSELKGDYGSEYSWLEVVCCKYIGLCDITYSFILDYKNFIDVIYKKGLGYFYNKYNQSSYSLEETDFNDEDFVPNYILENNQKIFNINWVKAEKSLIYFLLNRPSCVNFVYQYLNTPLGHKYIFEDLNFEYIKKHDFSTKEIIKNIGSEETEHYLNKIQKEYNFIDVSNDSLLLFFISCLAFFQVKQISNQDNNIKSIEFFKKEVLLKKYRTLLHIEYGIQYKILK